MKCIVTGAAGFIGSHTARTLLERGDKVVGLDNFNDYYDLSQKEANAKSLEAFDSFRMERLDIRDANAMEDLLAKEKPDVLVHLAARAGVRPSIEDPELYCEVNTIGTVNLLEAARKAGVNHVVMASSSSVYGKQEKIPFSEGDFTENPISPYAATKRGNENIAYMYSKMYGMKMTCLRFFTVYGPSGRPDMAPFLFTKWIDEGTPVRRFGDGTTKRDYTFVKDIVAGVVACCDKPFDFEILNLGNNKPEFLNDLIGTIEKHLGKKAIIEQHPEQPGDVPMTYSDITKAQELLGYEPTTSLDEGMKQFIHWYKNRS